MKQINNQPPTVYLSTYDNSDALLQVSEKYKNAENICVAVKFGDIVVKISPKNTCQCTWDEAMEKHRGELTYPVYWQIVGVVYHDVNQALKMLGHEPIRDVWTNTENNDSYYSDILAWRYRGASGYMNAYRKRYSSSVRIAKVFKL